MGEVITFRQAAVGFPRAVVSPLPITAKQCRALLLRDAALKIIRAKGVALETDDHLLTQAYVGGLHLSHHSPLACTRHLYPPSIPVRLQWPTPSLMNGLDVWAVDGKVLNIEWENDGGFSVHAFRKGMWQELIFVIARSLPVGDGGRQ